MYVIIHTVRIYMYSCMHICIHTYAVHTGGIVITWKYIRMKNKIH